MPVLSRLAQLSARQLFLLDGLGALLSAGLLGLLARFERLFGLPPAVLYGLVPVALSLAAYSLACRWLLRTNPRPYLRLLGAANLAYCGLTLGLVAWWWPRPTALGLLYTGLELLIVGALAGAELRASRIR